MQRSIKLNSIFVFVIFYILYHIFSVNNGVLAYIKLSHLRAQKIYELESLNKTKDNLENKVWNLSSDAPNLETLDFAAREELGLISDNEYVIFCK